MATQPTFWATSTLMPYTPMHETFVGRLDATVSAQRISTRGVGGAALAKQKAACEWFVESLYQGFCCIPPCAVALPRSPAKYSTGREPRIPHGYDVVTRVLTAAESLRWVLVVLGAEFGDSGKGQVTRVRATGDLLQHFHILGVRWQEVEPPPREDLIVIAMEAKGKDRRRAEPGDDDRVMSMQENLFRINEYLLSQCICLNCSDDTLLDPEDGVVNQGKVKANGKGYSLKEKPRALNFQNVAMRRIFAHGSLDKGGRFYHGWWQHIRSEYRTHIMVGDRLTVECDYSGIALVCLYAREGQPMDDGDAYDIGLNYSGGNDPRRKIVKQYLNAIINDFKGTYRIDSDKLRELGLTSRELRRRIHKRHHRVEHMFHTGVGLELQYVDSRIAEQVMLRFMEMDEVCLPVHDSFIVRRGLESRLLSVMQTEFERETGSTIKIKSSVGEPSAGLGTLSDSLRPDPGQSGPDAVATMLAQHLADFSISLRYLNSWREQCMTESQRWAEDLAIEHEVQAQKENDPPPDRLSLIQALTFALAALDGELGERFTDAERLAAKLECEQLLQEIAGGGKGSVE